MNNQIISNVRTLIPFSQSKIYQHFHNAPVAYKEIKDENIASAVLLPIGTDHYGREPYLILNKRSARVMQPGDLCFPGGRVAKRLDAILNQLLKLPFTPLKGWKYWPTIKRDFTTIPSNLSLAFTAALRESMEEMRLNPMKVQFLGPLPEQQLIMFKRKIFPLAGFIRQQIFFPNWEVESIIKIPLYKLLNPNNYAAYRLYAASASKTGQLDLIGTFPCYIHRYKGADELLWGVTYRITAEFLKIVFDFSPPDINDLPSIRGILSRKYLDPMKK